MFSRKGRPNGHLVGWRFVAVVSLANAACVPAEPIDAGPRSSAADASSEVPHHDPIRADGNLGLNRTGDAGDAATPELGKLVVALRESADAPADLYLVPLDGGSPSPVGRTPSRHEFQPRWSPDRRKIAFLALPADAPMGTPASLFVVDADGTNERELASDVSGAFVSGSDRTYWPPAWNPAGDRVAYVHGLTPCPPPYDPDWYGGDPCISDLRVARLADAAVEDPHLPAGPSKWATEPIWLASGSILYTSMCFGEGCSSADPMLCRDQPMPGIYLEGRQLAFTKDAKRFALAVRRDQELYEYASLETPAPLKVCSTADAFESWWSGESCTDVAGANGWSPRWSPRENALVYLDATGVWMHPLTGTTPTQMMKTPRPAGIDW